MTSTSIAEVKAVQSIAAIPDQAVDMFTDRGFTLANRIAKAFASSDAVPAQFRQFNLKKAGGQEQWIENTSAIGNCLVAIEVARAVQMSIVAVMQNADMIEGKLRWSGKFVIAAINASRRFTPLRFDMRNHGPIKAPYKEKTGWDSEARKPIFTERTVDVENVECIAWALPYGTPVPAGVYTLQQARDAGLPVIESAPVTMKMAVEEGWYGKSGSKWQTELRHLMFMYRAGSFFGNIHAPDIVMGMGGRTAEEERDLAPTFDIGPDGSVTQVPVSELRRQPSGPAPMADVVTEPAPSAAPVAPTATATDGADVSAQQPGAPGQATQQPTAAAQQQQPAAPAQQRRPGRVQAAIE